MRSLATNCTGNTANMAAAKMLGICVSLGVVKSLLMTLSHLWIEINMGWTDHGM